MRKIEKDGSIYFEFESSEQDVKEQISDCLLTEDVTDNIMEAIFNASAKLKRRRLVAWQSVKDLLPEEYQNRRLSYDCITGKIEIKE